MPSRDTDLRRIETALKLSLEAVRRCASEAPRVTRKGDGGDPVTATDLAVNEVLRRHLPAAGEGWLSEETADTAERLACSRIWIVDPLDGTREFVEGVPEYAVSVGLVEDGRPVAGGVCNPATGDLFLGAEGLGCFDNGRPARVSSRAGLQGATLLASRSELRKGTWDPFRDAGFTVQPLGSVALKLAWVAAGRADATWSLAPKHEWDVAGGAALVAAAGGRTAGLDGAPARFNQADPWMSGLLAAPPALLAESLDRLRRAGIDGRNAVRSR